MTKFIRKKKVIFTILSLLVIILVWSIWGNTALQVNYITVSTNKLPEPFDGFRIAHLSDLHNSEFGHHNEKLLSLLESAKPDLIAITGDLVDSYNTNIEVALTFVTAAVKIAPTYYVTGNHEARIADYPKLREAMVAAGVIILDNSLVEFQRGEAFISVAGVIDPSFNTDYLTGDSQAVISDSLNGMITGQQFTLLLSHRPELFSTYVDYNIDLVLSGHAHGGQFRLPFVGGLVAPNQGLFPKYDGGLYTDKETNMIVSRGLGNSIIPLRFNNRPEVIIVELRP